MTQQIKIKTNMEAREVVKQHVTRKSKIEDEIRALQDVLRTHGVNMTDDLVDADGFPKPEIDIVTIRKTRVKIIYLQNDLKSVMKDIEEGLHKLHAEARLSKESVTSQSIEEVKSPEMEPFLLVDTVTAGSPAEKAGLKVNDLITRFGTVTLSNFSGLQMIGSIVQHSKGKELSIDIKRREEGQVVNLVPDTWEGRGLLGCNVVPIKK